MTPCSLISSVNLNLFFLPLIDSINKVLLVLELDSNESSITASHLVCYPFNSKTLSFAVETFPADPSELILYDYHTHGIQIHKVSSQKMHARDTDCYAKVIREPEIDNAIMSFIRRATREKNILNSFQFAPKNGSVTVFTPDDIECFSELDSSNLIQTGASRITPLGYGSSSYSDNNQHGGNIQEQILCNIEYLRKYIDTSVNTSINTLRSHFSKEMTELHRPFDKQTSVFLMDKLTIIENRMQVLAENQKKLLDIFTKPPAVGTIISTLPLCEKSRNFLNNNIETFDKQALNFVDKIFKNKAFVSLINSSFSAKLDEDVRLVLQKELKIIIESARLVFDRGAEAYIYSVGKHIDSLVTSKINKITVNQQEIAKTGNMPDDRIASVMQRNMDSLYQRIHLVISTAFSYFYKSLEKFNLNSFKINEDKQQMSKYLENSIIIPTDFNEAFTLSINQLQPIILKRLLMSAKPSELFNRENNIPSALIKEFIKLVSDDFIEIDSDLLNRHLIEAIIAVKVSSEPFDYEHILALRKIEKRLRNLHETGTADKSIIMMTLSVIQTVYQS